MVITNIPKLIYIWRLSVQIIGRWGRAHKRLTSILIVMETIPLMIIQSLRREEETPRKLMKLKTLSEKCSNSPIVR